MAGLPSQFKSIKKRFPKYSAARDALGKALHASGPITKKNAQLIQLTAAATIGSEGSVHSHTRRAIKAGAKPKELYHALILATSIIGFPRVSAALSWVDDIVEKK